MSASDSYPCIGTLVVGQDTLDQVDDPEQDLEAKWQRAIDLREFPDTGLAHGIFLNMQKYPDDIILTRVGMFYEVSQDISSDLHDEKLNVSVLRR
jgi:hypothetical protein